MGVVIKHASKNAIFTYLGFIVGAFYTAILVPKVFSEFPEYWGVARLLISYTVIFAPFAMLGIPMAIIKYFPLFNKVERGKFIFGIVFWAFVGLSIISIIIFVIARYWFIDEQNILFNNNYFLLIPLIYGYVFMQIVDSIFQSLYKSNFYVFFKELGYRLIVLITILLYAFNIISFKVFLFSFSFAYIIVSIPLFIYLFNNKNITIKIDFSFLFTKRIKKIYIYAFFTMISASALIILNQIDSVMISKYLTLKDVAIYGPSLFIATTILVPSRSIMTVVRPMVADALSSNLIHKVKELYIKTSIVASTYAIFLFLIIWVNIDLVMNYYGASFGKGKYIVLFISLANIVNVLTGINGTIINISKYYKVDIIFQVILILLTIGTNIILIPIYGINGAAFATFLTVVIHNLIKLIYVYVVMKIQPFNSKSIMLVTLGTLLFILITYRPLFGNLFISSVIYSIFVTLFYWTIVYFLNFSKEINGLINKYLAKIIIK